MKAVVPEAPDKDLRVILVGRTGLDPSLRRDASLELVRVLSPLDAIGELATPIDDESPTRAVVVLGEDVQDQLLGANGHVPDAESSDTREGVVDFVRAVRLVDPAARVLAASGAHAGELRELVDGSIDPDGTPDAMARSLRPGAERVANPAPAASLIPAHTEHAELPPDPLVAIGGVEPAAISTIGEADLPLVEAMLRGQDVVPAALALLRRRVADESVDFVALERLESGAHTHAAAVSWSGAVHGHLVSARTDEPALEPHARWLAGWMRLRDLQTQLRHAAFTDSLTGAWNRRYFDRFLGAAIDGARTNRWNVSVLVFDIDDFKRYNDEFGHDAGDEVLVESVRLLRSVTRPSDRVCRMGGDEFAVIFHDPKGPRAPESRHPATAFAITRRFQQQILNHQFPKLARCAPGTLTISAGLATFPWDGSASAELLARADERAMISKRQGKNAITLGPGAEPPPAP